MSPPFEPLLTAWPRLLLVVAVAFVVAEAWRRLALRRGVLDLPGHRSSHAVPTPRGAGIGIAVGVALALLLWVPPGVTRDAVLLGGLVVGVVGLIDDFRPLPPAWKFTGQALAALPVAIALPWSPEGLPVVVPPVLAVASSAALILLFVNAWNFMDGIDGIATLSAMAVSASVIIVSSGAAQGIAAGLASAVFAACLGFLPLNFPKARVFMGDCGSHVLGFGMAVLILAAPDVPSASVAALASAPFVIDVLGTLVLRARDGERLAAGHRRHLYQLVTRCGYSHGRVTTAYGAWMLVSGGGMAMAQTVGLGGIFAVLSVAVTASAWWLMQRHFTSLLKERGQW